MMGGMAATRALSPKQQLFVAEYLVDLNATAAYKRAGYKPRTDAAAAESASRLLRNVKVAAAVAAAQTKREQRTEITQDWVLGRLKIEATSEGEDSSHAARVSALKVIAQHLGMLKERVEHTGKDGGPLGIDAMVAAVIAAEEALRGRPDSRAAKPAP